jgi:hypothetical protein
MHAASLCWFSPAGISRSGFRGRSATMSALDARLILLRNTAIRCSRSKSRAAKKRPLTETRLPRCDYVRGHDSGVVEGAPQCDCRPYPTTGCSSSTSIPMDALAASSCAAPRLRAFPPHASWWMASAVPTTRSSYCRSIGAVAKGVDVCGVGGFTVWWPSAGLPCDGDLLNLVPPPDWLIAELQRRSVTRMDDVRPAADWARIAAEGAPERATQPYAGAHRWALLPTTRRARCLRVVSCLGCARCRAGDGPR